MFLIDLDSLSALSDDALKILMDKAQEEYTKRKLEKDYDLLKHGFVKFGCEFKSGIYVAKIETLKQLYCLIAAGDDGTCFRTTIACSVSGTIFTLINTWCSQEKEKKVALREYESEHDYYQGDYLHENEITREEAMELLQMCTSINLKN